VKYSNLFARKNDEKPETAVDSEEMSIEQFPAICLAPSYAEAEACAKTPYAFGLQLHFAGALSGVPMERTADQKRSRRSSGNSLHAHL